MGENALEKSKRSKEILHTRSHFDREQLKDTIKNSGESNG